MATEMKETGTMRDNVSSMACPVCKVPLAMADRQGVEIDYCPQCRGVWLDRGELDKIIERSAAEMAPPPAAAPVARSDDQAGSGGYGGGGYGKHGGHHGGSGKHGGYRRKSWLQELFD